MNIAQALELTGPPRTDSPSFAMPAGPSSPMYSTDTSAAEGKALHELDPVTRIRARPRLPGAARLIGFAIDLPTAAKRSGRH